MIDLQKLRDEYPILTQTVHGRPLVYLDSAATLQMAEPVLESLVQHYHRQNANVHRGVHTLSRQSSYAMDEARRIVRDFLHARGTAEIVFTAGTTDGINFLARQLSESVLAAGDEVIVSAMEHHSNLIPWQEACRRHNANLRIIPLTQAGELDMDAYRNMLSCRTKIVAVTWVSNVLGTVNPVKEIVSLAHDAGACVLIDAAQAMRQSIVDVQDLGCDFLVFSGHKLGALTGTGVLYIQDAWLPYLYPQSSGGGMVRSASHSAAIYEDAPFCFEAGTPNYVGHISLGSAMEHLCRLGLTEIETWENELLSRTEQLLRELPEVRILGTPSQRSSCISFTVKDIHAYDLGLMLDAQGIAVRTGHLCAQPLLDLFGTEHAVRLSPAFYNSMTDLERMQQALKTAITRLKGANT